jgi:hypothetical protein
MAKHLAALDEFISKYCSKFEVKQEMISMEMYSGSFSIPGKTRSVSIEMQYHNIVEVADICEKHKYELEIIKNNATVREAYEQFQILLKLSDDTQRTTSRIY